jgi:hypothetical protein
VPSSLPNGAGVTLFPTAPDADHMSAHHDSFTLNALRKGALDAKLMEQIPLIAQAIEARFQGQRFSPPIPKESEMKRAMDWLEARRLNHGDVDTGILVDAALLFENPHRAALFMDLPEHIRLPWLLKYLTQGNPYAKA